MPSPLSARSCSKECIVVEGHVTRIFAHTKFVAVAPYKGAGQDRTQKRKCFVQPVFFLFETESTVNKTRLLILVAAAGSAAASSLELPALGSNVGPGEKKKEVSTSPD